MFANEELKKATIISSLLIGGIFLPLSLRMYFKSKNGSYTNFDVSDRIQRKSLYTFALPLMVIVTIILFATKQKENLSISVLFATILIIVSQVVNLYIKSSMHVALNIYLSFLVIPMNLKTGIILLFLTFLIGWSRVNLKRHTIKEVLFGCLIGTTISIIMLFAEGYL